MKRICYYLLALWLAACSGLQPYKDQSLDQLKNIAHHPDQYTGKIVSFGGEIKGLVEDTQTIRLVLKTEVPFYYYATGKGNTLSYELLLADYPKPTPAMSGLTKGTEIKILARVTDYKKRNNMLGNEIGILQLTAFALADRRRKQDFFHTTAPEKQLYESWKAGRLFYQETPEQIIALYPAAAVQPPAAHSAPTDKKISPAAHELVYDEEEEFVLTPVP